MWRTGIRVWRIRSVAGWDDGDLLVRAEEPGEDFAAYSNDSFNQGGQLGHIRFGAARCTGSGYEQEGSIAKGSMAAPASEFLSTKIGKPS